MENQGLPRVLVFGLLGIILLFIFGSSMFITINPGQKGVLFETLGNGLDKETNELYKIPITGIIINSVTKNGYNLIELKNNLEELTGLPVLGSVQHMDIFQLEKFIEIFSENIELEKFL